MATVFADLASDSLTDIGQLGEGQSASPEQINRALRYANRMLQKWSIQRFMLPTINSRTLVVTPGLQDYTLGPSASGPGSFVGIRPVFVESAQMVLPGSAMYEPLNLLDKSKWGAIRDKGATCSAVGLPQDIFIEYQYPNILFHLWTIPANGATLIMAAWDILQEFLTPFDQLDLPPGYEECIEKNLAVELCSAYDMEPPPSLQMLANDSMVQVQKNNAQSIGGALGESQNLSTPNVAIPLSAGGQ